MSIENGTTTGVGSNAAAALSPAEHARLVEQFHEARAVFYDTGQKLGLPIFSNVPPVAPSSVPVDDDLGVISAPSSLADLVHPPGLVGRLIDWMEAGAERPKRALYLAAALAFVGTLAGRKFASPTDLRTNLYFATLAPSGHGKDHPIRKIAQLAQAAGLDRYYGPAHFMSASGLRSLIQREPSVVCYMDEFASLMRQIHDRKAGLHNQMIKHDLLQLFSAANRIFAGAEYAATPATKIAAPNLSISGTSTPDDFWSSLTSLSTMDGLLARIILINVDGPKTPRREPLIGPREVPADLIEACRRLAEARPVGNLASARGDAPEPRIVEFDDGGREALLAFTDKMDAAEEGSSETPLTRVREHAIKLALTVAVGVDPDAPVITAEMFDWASRLALLSAATIMGEARDRIADNEREAAYNRILHLVRKAGRAGIAPGTLGDKCRGIDKRMREQIIADLEESGRVIRVREETGKKGRPTDRLVSTDFRR
ncbi:MAG TPA: DUF3987 domain-containing protein [Sphingomicrobium sp.]